MYITIHDDDFAGPFKEMTTVVENPTGPRVFHDAAQLAVDWYHRRRRTEDEVYKDD